MGAKLLQGRRPPKGGTYGEYLRGAPNGGTEGEHLSGAIKGGIQEGYARGHVDVSEAACKQGTCSAVRTQPWVSKEGSATQIYAWPFPLLAPAHPTHARSSK